MEADQPAPEFLPAPIDQPPAPHDDLFWGWHDFFLFIFVTLVALAVAMLTAAGIRHIFHISETRMNVVFVIAQFAAYGISFASLKLMFRAEYGEPLLRSLHWLPSRIAPVTLATLGLGQAFTIAIIGSMMSIPQTENQMTKLMSDRPTAIVLAILGVTIAPLAEELAFRGLLQPLMIRLAGVLPGILGTSVLF